MRMMRMVRIMRIMRIMRMLSMLEAAGIFDEIPIMMILLICRQQDECGRQDESMMRSSGSQTAGQSKMPTDPSGFHIAHRRPLPYRPSNKVCPVKVCAGGELLDFGLIA